MSETGLPRQPHSVAAVLGLWALGQGWSWNRSGFSTSRPWDCAAPTLVTAYAIGSVAMFWMIERVSAF